MFVLFFLMFKYWLQQLLLDILVPHTRNEHFSCRHYHWFCYWWWCWFCYCFFLFELKRDDARTIHMRFTILSLFAQNETIKCWQFCTWYKFLTAMSLSRLNLKRVSLTNNTYSPAILSVSVSDAIIMFSLKVIQPFNFLLLMPFSLRLFLLLSHIVYFFSCFISNSDFLISRQKVQMVLNA